MRTCHHCGAQIVLNPELTNDPLWPLGDPYARWRHDLWVHVNPESPDRPALCRATFAAPMDAA